MESVHIPATDVGPDIELSVGGRLCITGRSMMEDPSRYYEPAHSWLDKFLGSQPQSLTIEFDLSYFNSSSAKQLLRMLMTIDDAEVNGSVKWVYPNGNDVLLERGQELQIMVDLPFSFLPK